MLLSSEFHINQIPIALSYELSEIASPVVAHSLDLLS